MPSIHVSNTEFIQAIFGDWSAFCHVTDFNYDPGAIPADRHLAAWKGDWFQNYRFGQNTNQYFTISTFAPDEKGVARRRKALYQRTHCVVLDDVKEKLSLNEVQKLPRPTWILETSNGSEQWGYILTAPCADRHRAENLLDGLVANGLAPDGKDPGMKGVTRYVRLPEGINNKASKLVNGQPFQCQMLLWEPFNTATLEQLAQPFHVDLDATRREARVDGASDVSDHPLLQIPDIIRIKEVRSDGRFDITCPWVDEHTGADDSGSAVFTNGDGTIGFKCHHGACQSRTGADLLRHIEQQVPGFGEQFNMWKVLRSFGGGATGLHVGSCGTDSQSVGSVEGTQPPAAGGQGISEPQQSLPDFSAPAGSNVAGGRPVSGTGTSGPAATPEAGLVAQQQTDPFKYALAQIRMYEPGTEQQRTQAAEFLKLVEDSNDKIRAKQLHDELRDIMNWSKADLKEIITDLREHWYQSKSDAELDFFNDVVFVMEQNQFYDRQRKLFYTPEAYANSFGDRDPEARKNALQGGMVMKVHKLDYAPKKTPVFEENNCIYANLWRDKGEPANTPGDCSVWLNHFDTLGWGGEIRKHVLQFLAFTIKHPDVKINHILLFGGEEGIGKDWLLYPLTKAMADDHKTISGHDLLGNFNSYVMGVKHLHINETELGDHREAMQISTKLKPLATCPPYTLNVNQKNVREVDIRNIVNVTMSTNSRLPFKLTGPSRRYYPLWSDYDPRDMNCELRPEWQQFWKEAWFWMENGGAEICLHYLLNEVDLSDFNPGAAPPVTEFLRDIMESSKSPLAMTIEEFIDSMMGAFKADIMTAGDITTALKMGDMPMTAHMMHVDAKRVNSGAVGRVLQESRKIVKRRGRTETSTARLYVVRNHNRYTGMSQRDLMLEYQRQKQNVAGGTPLTVVS